MEKLDNSENTHSEEYARQRLLDSPLSFDFDHYELELKVNNPRTNSIISFEDSNASD